LLGLNDTGKTTYLSILQKIFLTPPFPALSYPTLGFNIGVIQLSSQYTIWDLGGSESVRTYWKCYYANVKGVIFFIDRSDLARRDLALLLLKNVVLEVKDCVFLILLSKKDCEDQIRVVADLEKIMEGQKWNLCEVTCYDAFCVKESF
ncbi:hypothetical protein COBT_002420, partial [Conglomerata obtusa]